MNAVKIWACVAALAAGGMLSWQAVGEDAPAKSAVKTESRSRLPAQYGKLGLSEEVKDELYLIDEEYDAKIDVLTAQIKELQAERETKMQEKLSPAQQTQLKELRAAAAAKRTKAEAKKEKAEGEAKPAAPAEATPKSGS